jgi:hypothetical protein
VRAQSAAFSHGLTLDIASSRRLVSDSTRGWNFGSPG